ncbi:MAG: MerR family transcriptional regulator [Rhodospirillales bacterium]|nr:MAG: MerR family transcriptional regulator [Rhodospirillales bacterium]
MPEAAEPLSPCRHASKSPTAFRTIAEASAELDLPQHVLRFWESKFAQIRPLKRGGGRRYYRPEDLELLRRIRHLLHNEGYTIRGAQKLLRQDKAKTARANGGEDAAPASQASRGQGLDAATRDELRRIIRELETLKVLVSAGGR